MSTKYILRKRFRYPVVSCYIRKKAMNHIVFIVVNPFLIIAIARKSTWNSLYSANVYFNTNGILYHDRKSYRYFLGKSTSIEKTMY